MWLTILFTINLISFIVMGRDKSFAKGERRRISEKSLLLLACFGGSLGILLGMYLWKHKTRKIKFYLGVPVIIAVQFAVVYILFWRII